MRRQLRKPGFLLLTMLVFVAIGVMVRLGVWQLDRRQEKIELNATRQKLRSAPPVSLPHVPEGDLLERAAFADGHFLPGAQYKIVNRGYRGAPGIDLVSVFQLHTGELLLVDRGFAPLSMREKPPAPPEGDLRLHGYLFVPRYDDREAHPATLPPDEWVRLDPVLMASAAEKPYLPYALVITGTVETAHWPQPKSLPPMDEGPHFSYAVQWFSFATIFLVGWLAVLWRATRSPAE